MKILSESINMGDNYGFSDSEIYNKKYTNKNDYFDKKFTYFHSNISKKLEDKVNENKTSTKGNKASWKDLLFNFGLDTTFHGPKLIVQHQPFALRRCLWMLLFMTGTAVFLVQTVTSVQKYRSFPVSVNVKINYNTSIIFPAVTICNGNAFRSTKSYVKGYYDLITDVYGNPSFTDFSNYNSTPNLHELYSETGHSKEDLIVRCLWYNKPCHMDDFVTTMTDFGKCYTFNSGTDSSTIKVAFETGTKGGLRLQLNIEQYEYMLGPNEGAGLKVLIHHPDDIPLVGDHGLALPPGSHGLIGVTALEVNNLPPNYGICNDSVVLEYVKEYSILNCYTNCKERYVAQKCNCRDMYMPTKTGLPPVCNINVYNSCMKPAEEEFNSKIKETCQVDCPVPCHSILYQPLVSYASISNFDIEALLKGNSTKSLSTSYINARETTQRVNKATIREDVTLTNNLKSVVDILDVKMKDMYSDLHTTKKSLQAFFTNLEKRLEFHLDRGLEAVRFIVEHDFIRGWDVFKERAFHYVTMDFMDFSQTLKIVIDEANGTISLMNKTSRQLIYSPVQAMFMRRKKLIERTVEFIDETKDAYVNGTPLLTYRLTYKRRYDMSYISVPLINAGIKDEQYNYEQLLVGCERMNLGLDVLLAVGNTFVETGYFNESYFLHGEERFLNGGRRFNYRIFMYETRIIHKPLEVINKRIEDFLRLDRALHDNQHNVEWKISQFNILFENSHEHWKDILNVTKMSVEYINNINLMKSPLANIVTSKALAESVRLLSVFFQDVKFRVRELQDMLTVLLASYKAIWTSMLTEESTKEFYYMIYNDSQTFLRDNSTHNREYFLPIFAYMLRTNVSYLKTLSPEEVVLCVNGDIFGINVTEFLKDMDSLFTNYSQILDLSIHLQDYDALFLTSFENYKATMMNFVKENQIDTSFFKQNFMTLDVFMQELSYEEIRQQEAYDLTQMLNRIEQSITCVFSREQFGGHSAWCAPLTRDKLPFPVLTTSPILGEIGGSMGLFIGGSVISVFEFLDVFIHHAARVAFNR